jgi:hypothetical protein
LSGLLRSRTEPTVYSEEVKKKLQEERTEKYASRKTGPLCGSGQQVDSTK